MNKQRSPLAQLWLFLPLLIALISLFSVLSGHQQARLPVPMPLSFSGDYSYDGETWLPLTPDAPLSARGGGNLYLRGHFEQTLPKGEFLHYYRNHIGVSVYLNGERLFIDAVTETAGMGQRLHASMCAQEWAQIRSPGITAQDEVTIRLYNPHRFGNASAYRDFLTTLCGETQGSNLLQKNLEAFGAPLRLAGGLCAIVSLMLLGAAVAAAIARVPLGGKLLKQGLLMLFVGGFFLFDTLDVAFWNELVALNTQIRLLCVMLAVFLLSAFVCDALSGKPKAAAQVALALSSLLSAALMAAPLAARVTPFDVFPVWVLAQMALCPLFMLCCALCLPRAPRENQLVLLSGLLLFAAIPLDLFGVGASLVLGSPCTKFLFLALFAVHLVDAARGILVNHRATLRAQRLERELEDSRISIMLSQIQPHFLYNVLGTIRGLCREDPMQARQALGDFSDYLRGNMSALSNSHMIDFSVELRHIEAYLRLEKMRMGERLNILYDIQERQFSIPPLTIQPLVENAVKHGLFEKGGGILIVQTRREGDQIVVSVTDDGVGFEEGAPLLPDEHHAHVGLANVRSRLETLCGGRLVVESAPGRGTTATVFLRGDFDTNGGEHPDEHPGR